MATEADIPARLKQAQETTQRAASQRAHYYDSMLQPGAGATGGPAAAASPAGGVEGGFPEGFPSGVGRSAASGFAAAGAGASATSQADLERLQHNLRSVESSYLAEIEQLRLAIENVDGERLQALDLYERALGDSERMRGAVLNLEAENGKLRGELLQIQDAAMVERRRREQLAFQFGRDIDFFVRRETQLHTAHEASARGELIARWQAWVDVMATEMRCERSLISRALKLEQVNDFRFEQRVRELELRESQLALDAKHAGAASGDRARLEAELGSLSKALAEQRRDGAREVGGVRTELASAVRHSRELALELEEAYMETLLLQEGLERSRLSQHEAATMAAHLWRFHAAFHQQLRAQEQKRGSEGSAGGDAQRELQLLRRLLMEAKEDAFNARRELEELRAVRRAGTRPVPQQPPEESAVASAAAATCPVPVAGMGGGPAPEAVAAAVQQAVREQLEPLGKRLDTLAALASAAAAHRDASDAPRHRSPSGFTSIATSGAAAQQQQQQDVSSSMLDVPASEDAPAAGLRVEPTPPITPPLPLASGGGGGGGGGGAGAGVAGDAAVLRVVFNKEMSHISEVLQELRAVAAAGLTPSKQRQVADAESEVAALHTTAALQALERRMEEHDTLLRRIDSAVEGIDVRLGAAAAKEIAVHEEKAANTLASMRHAVRNLLVSTTHNHKLLGDRLESLRAGQNELATTLAATQHRNALSMSSDGGGGGNHGDTAPPLPTFAEQPRTSTDGGAPCTTSNKDSVLAQHGESTMMNASKPTHSWDEDDDEESDAPAGGRRDTHARASAPRAGFSPQQTPFDADDE